ncbi:MAG: GNAT family N-acetyltransferase [Gemmobacter sp.]
MIRDAGPADEQAWRGLWARYLAFYSVTLPPQVTDRTWARAMDPLSPLTARLAVEGDRVLGFALHHWHLSTWGMGADGYLEDLFVADDARGKGLGRALIDDLIALARAQGWSRLYWHTNIGNAQARRLYDTYVRSDGHVRYRIVL